MAKHTYRLSGFSSVKMNGFSSLKLPKLKGHVKLTLHNCKNGKNEVFEGDNIITYAVRDIFANNYLGAIDYSKLMPLWSKWYSGILCYQNAFDEDPQTDKPYPDDYFPQGDDVNPVTAHAGTTVPQDFADDLKRGMPNTAGQVFADGVVKQAWEWGSTQGNGVISALALTHADTGNCGLGSSSNAFAGYSPFALIQGSQLPSISVSAGSKNVIACQYDDNHSLFFHHGEDGDFAIGSVQFSSTEITVHIRRLPFFKAGLYETFVPSDYERVFTVTIPFTVYCIPAYYFDYDNKQLWIFSNLTAAKSHSSTTVNYCVIDCENEEVLSSGTIVSDTSELAPVCCCNNNVRARRGSMYDYAQIIKDGNYVYLPTGSVTWGDSDGWDPCYAIINGYKKIDITNQADQEKINYNSNQNTFRPIMKAGGLLVSSGRVMNGGVGYSCADQFANPNLSDLSYIGWTFSRQDKVSAYVSAKASGYTSSTEARYIAANKMVNTSKWNLPSSVQKTSSHSMTIEYTLQEVSENE